jgi:hypothetical protein
LRIAIALMKEHFLLVSWLIESFCGIEKEKSDVVCKKMKNRIGVCYCLIPVKAHNEG